MCVFVYCCALLFAMDYLDLLEILNYVHQLGRVPSVVKLMYVVPGILTSGTVYLVQMYIEFNMIKTQY